MGECEGGLRRRHHPADLDVPRGDDPVGVGLQFGVGKSVLRRPQRRFGSLQGGLRRAQLLIRFIKGGLRDGPRAQQRLVPLEGQRLLSGNRLCRLQPGPGDLHIGTLFAVIEAGENVAGVHGRTDVDKALDHPAADAERQVGLDPRLHLAGDLRSRLILGGARREWRGHAAAVARLLLCLRRRRVGRRRDRFQ